MNNKFNNPWNTGWANFQNNQFDSLASFFQPNTSAIGFGQDPLLQSMNYWWNSNHQAPPTDQFDMLNKMLNQSKSLYFLGDQFSQILNSMSGQKQGKKAWKKNLEQQFELMKESFINQTDQLDESFSSEWYTAQNAWESMLNVLPGFTELKNGIFKDTDINEYIEKYMSMPGLGLSRELQEKVQRCLLSYKRYQEESETFKNAMTEVAVRAMDLLKNKLIEHSKKDDKIDSLKQIYDLWVDCNEECYAEYTLTEDYSKKYGDLVNSMMLYQKDYAEVMEDCYGALNVPSKKDYDDLIKEQHALKQKLKQSSYEKQQEQQKYDSLKQELDELREALHSKPEKKSAAAATRKKKKKTAKKKNTVSKKTVSKKAANKKKSAKRKAVKKITDQKTPSENTNVIEIKF